MGGAAVSPSGKGGRKAVDATINLVPFIDLLSCCISFFFFSAVWVNLANLQAKPSSARGGSEPPPDEPSVSLVLRLDAGGFVLSRSTGEVVRIDRDGDRLNLGRLSRAMRDVKAALPQKSDLTLHANDRIPYDEVIQTLDILHGADFPDVQIDDRGDG